MRFFIGFVAILLAPLAAAHETPDRATVTKSLHRAVTFFRQHASAGGGYVFQLSADLQKREGEGRVDATTAWIEPPATPAVGMALLEAYRLCDDPILLAAAKETANALVQGQLRSGGWGEKIDFDAKKRSWQSYRVESENEGRNTSTFDDDKTQSAIRLLVQIDRELNFEDDTIHEAAHYALNAVLKAQYPCGAWPQRFTGRLPHSDPKLRPASLPNEWPLEFPNRSYDKYYTLNDNTLSDVITTLLDAWEVYDDDRYLKAAQRGGDFLLLAQLPEPVLDRFAINRSAAARSSGVSTSGPSGSAATATRISMPSHIARSCSSFSDSSK